MAMDKKMGMKMGDRHCMMCGASCGQCGCGKVFAVYGLVFVVLGVLLWGGWYGVTLDKAASVVLVLWGLKKFMMGLKGGMCC